MYARGSGRTGVDRRVARPSLEHRSSGGAGGAHLAAGDVGESVDEKPVFVVGRASDGGMHAGAGNPEVGGSTVCGIAQEQHAGRHLRVRFNHQRHGGVGTREQTQEQGRDRLRKLHLGHRVVPHIEAERRAKLATDRGRGNAVRGRDLDNVVVGRRLGVTQVAAVHQLPRSRQRARVRRCLELVGPQLHPANIDGQAAEAHENGENDNEVNKHWRPSSRAEAT
jgi:hypothetical protein